MPDESFPLRIGGEEYSLRFEDKDVQEIEKTISLFAAFHPQYRTYDNATAILWRGLRKTTDNGELVYAIQQGPPGRTLALQKVKEFCQQFSSTTAAMVVLYGSFDKALIITGWHGKPVPEDQQKPPQEPTGDEPKN